VLDEAVHVKRTPVCVKFVYAKFVTSLGTVVSGGIATSFVNTADCTALVLPAVSFAIYFSVVVALKVIGAEYTVLETVGVELSSV
jgi:hypothetical protein